MKGLSAIVFVAISLVSADQEGAASPPAPSMQLILRASQLPWDRPDEPEVEIVYRNVGNWGVRLNVRSQVHSRFAFPGQGELSFEVRRTDGKEVPFACKVRAFGPGNLDYIVLWPKREFVVRTSINCYIGSRKGTFRVQARFHDRNPEPPADKLAVPLAMGPLESNEIIVEVPRGAAQPSR